MENTDKLLDITREEYDNYPLESGCVSGGGGCECECGDYS